MILNVVNFLSPTVSLDEFNVIVKNVQVIKKTLRPLER